MLSKGQKDAHTTSCSCRALSDLSVANLIQYDLLTHAVVALPEAHIMTKHVIKFDTIVALMKLPHDCNMPALFQDISSCCELLKPLRRNEKSLLNGFMKIIRFPIKIKVFDLYLICYSDKCLLSNLKLFAIFDYFLLLTKVQDSAIKGYVLMQAAVERLPILDFSLRVEQSEIVEVALRILSALQALCIERGIGNLMETAVLVDRALRVRMWEVDYGSIFFQCPGLSEITRKGLDERPIHNVSDLDDCSSSRVQDLLACSNYEAKQVLLFSEMFKKWTLDLYVNYGLINDTAGSSTRVDYDKRVMKIDVVRTRVHNSSGVTRQEISPQSRMVDIAPPSFHLICYHAQTSVLLCYRKLVFDNTSDSDRGNELILRSYSVPLPSNIFLGDVKCLLLSSIVGLDTVLVPRGVQPIENSPQLSPILAKTRVSMRLPSKKILAQSASKGVHQGEIGERISIHKSVKGEKLSINLPDGDMRAWMVRKSTAEISQGSSSSGALPLPMARKEHRRDEADETKSTLGRVDGNSEYSCSPLKQDNIQATSVMTSIGDMQTRGSCNFNLGRYLTEAPGISSPSTLVPITNNSETHEVPTMLDNSGLQRHSGAVVNFSAGNLYSNDVKQKRGEFSSYELEPYKVISSQIDINGQSDRSEFARFFGRKSDEIHEDENITNNIRVQSARSNTKLNLERSRSCGADDSPNKVDDSYLTKNHDFSNNKQWAHQSNSAVSGGCSAELAVLRRKNIELRLDSIPIKRLRTASSPGFRENEHSLNAHYKMDSENNPHTDSYADINYLRGGHNFRKDANIAQQPSGTECGGRLRSEDAPYFENLPLHPESQNYINDDDIWNSAHKQMKLQDNGPNLNSYFDNESEKYKTNSCSQKDTRDLRPKLQRKSSKQITPEMRGKPVVSGINKKSRFTHSCDGDDDGEYKAHVLDMDSDYFIEERGMQPVSQPSLTLLPIKNFAHGRSNHPSNYSKNSSPSVRSTLKQEISNSNNKSFKPERSTISRGETVDDNTTNTVIQGRSIQQQPPNMVTPSGLTQRFLHPKNMRGEQIGSTPNAAKSMTFASYGDRSENEDFEAGFF